MPDKTLLFAGTYDNLDNAWAVPATVLVGSGVGPAATTGSFYSGPAGCWITDVYYIARDLTFTDPAGEVHIGLRIRTSVDGGATLVVVDPTPIWATNDCPRIWDDLDNDTDEFALDVPVKAFPYIGAGLGGFIGPTEIPDIPIVSNVHVTIEVAPVLDQALVNMPDTDLDSFDVLVFGHYRTHSRV
jgi:hypothetical protein